MSSAKDPSESGVDAPEDPAAKQPSMLVAGGADEARAYVPPTALPLDSKHGAIDVEKVRLSPRVDPRRSPTIRRADAEEMLRQALAQDNAHDAALAIGATPYAATPFAPQVMPSPHGQTPQTSQAAPAHFAQQVMPGEHSHTQPPAAPFAPQVMQGHPGAVAAAQVPNATPFAPQGMQGHPAAMAAGQAQYATPFAPQAMHGHPAAVTATPVPNATPFGTQAMQAHPGPATATPVPNATPFGAPSRSA